MKSAFITGITGQDGSYLAELLLEKGYEVHGLVRRSSSFNRARIDPIWESHAEAAKNLHLHYGDMTDGGSLVNLLREICPDEVYNLAAQSHVKVSFEMPEYTASADSLGTIRLLEAIRQFVPEARFYQASTSEMFGATPPPQSESSPFYPRSPYGAAKLYAHWVTINYREAYDLFAVSGIAFNHESPRRGESFVTRKITQAVARIKLGLADELHLGNIDTIRDWGYAKEYVEAMWRTLQHDEPTTFVIGTGVGISVRQFCQTAFEHVGLDWEQYVRHDERYERPTDVDALIAAPGKALDLLGWKAETTAEALAQLMVDADLAAASRG
ncbi:GDP-mannose 4,6 dehydratase [Aeromicrobium sp. Root344]|uniref:GDP-mannose 4,6-dehydratase n=1 Tax=Aeromicrobium sp. Root344 TaxID=1736521 RepID=UPI0006FD6C63|nr:GDP-mannose 4,6-dehydratase [Aeromicrobium sp. Root344]KQV74407.1 GDP-mannose 4,6 dehydratase [Aeromicrobium sp. Root344]